jgi:hypothetical protein
MVHVLRAGDHVELTPFDARTVSELDRVASDLGFDRGELLAGVSCLLLVEGEHEIAVLERIFERELADAKISLVAMRGSPPKGLLEVDALWRFTKAAVAVCLDNVRQDLVDKAQDGDGSALLELRSPSSSSEEKALAVLIGHARSHQRDTVLLGHPGKDLIDALDPRAIRHEYERFPKTHAKTDAAYKAAIADAERDGKKKPGRKTLYEQLYGVPSHRDAYARMAAAHVALGLVPPELDRVVKAAAEAAQSADLASLGLLDP